MKLNATLTWIILIILTIVSALVSKLNSNYIVLLILLLSSLKFLGIAFQFMELKKAHGFWKGIIVAFLLFFITSIVVVF
ncbi:cytochrome C oxidase subunit IV family protein [Psychroserpens jangbogonensis]|uniref:cytochrome C oxidase subunit IV family protein n=1 Tax=Psychroserpens jangbogonensis TaxID=1484460 RepID=UPI00053D37A8